jgi:hypothetical protein
MRGQTVPDESAVLRTLGAPPYGSFHEARAFGGYTALRIDVDVDVLLAYAERGFACVVLGRPTYENGLASGLTSPHGPLHGGHHAIVVTGADAARLSYVDPWFPREGQPLRVPITDFVRDWWVSGLLSV